MAKSQTDAGTTTVQWRDQEFTIRRKMGIRAFVALRDGDAMLALERILGEQQWQAFIDSDPEPDMGDADDLFGAIIAAFGLTPGESSASST